MFKRQIPLRNLPKTTEIPRATTGTSQEPPQEPPKSHRNLEEPPQDEEEDEDEDEEEKRELDEHNSLNTKSDEFDFLYPR